MKLSPANIILVLRVFAGILMVTTTLPAAAQQRTLTAADFPKVVLKVNESLRGLKGKDLTERLVLSPYDGTALRLALSKASPDFLKGTTAEELIAELSTLRAESMKQLMPEILAPINDRRRESMKKQSPGAMLHRKQKFMQPLIVHPLAFLTAVYVEAPPQPYEAPLEGRSEFKDDNSSLTAVNEYEIVVNGMTGNVREEITTSVETRYIRFRHVKRETVEQNGDPNALGRYVVEQGIMDSKIDSKSGSNTIKSVNPRRLRPTGTHRVTTEIIREAKVERCPNADGISRGETLVSMTIRGTSGAMGNGAPLFIEIVSSGKVTGHVDDAATLTGFDWEVSSQSRHESLNKGENFRLAQAMTMRTGGNTMVSAELGELVVSGVGSNEAARDLLKLQDASMDDAAGPLFLVYDQAEAEWQRGNCVELVVTSGAESQRLRSGDTRKLVVEARHWYEPPPLAVPVTGTPSGGTLTPTTPVKTPSATFTFKSDEEGEGGGAVTFKSVSRRGIARDVIVGFIPIGRTPIKVEVSYFQNETKTIKRATLPGVKISGGEITEQIHMAHTSVLYHYPSPSALKKGYLVLAENDDPEPGSKTKYLVESGYYDYSKNEQSAEVKGMIGDMEAVKGEEKGSTEKLSGNASLSHPSQIVFYKGDTNNPPQFSWDVDYNGKGGAAMVLAKDDEGVKWVVNKITDPTSLYKTEYLLELKLNAAEELKKGDKAMKDVFGFKLDDLAKVLDPTKQQQGSIAGASGSQTITVRVLSPYPDETEQWVAPPKTDLKDILKQVEKNNKKP